MHNLNLVVDAHTILILHIDMKSYHVCGVVIFQ